MVQKVEYTEYTKIVTPPKLRLFNAWYSHASCIVRIHYEWERGEKWMWRLRRMLLHKHWIRLLLRETDDYIMECLRNKSSWHRRWYCPTRSNKHPVAAFKQRTEHMGKKIYKPNVQDHDRQSWGNRKRQRKTSWSLIMYLSIKKLLGKESMGKRRIRWESGKQAWSYRAYITRPVLYSRSRKKSSSVTAIKNHLSKWDGTE